MQRPKARTSTGPCSSSRKAANQTGKEQLVDCSGCSGLHEAAQAMLTSSGPCSGLQMTMHGL
jgi:hypothetical protein